jgi:trigger factor
LQVEVEHPATGEARLKVAIGENEVRAAKEKAARRLSQQRTIPGFRRGKAPLSVVERTLGEAAVRSEALDNLLPEVVEKSLAQAEVEAFDTPEVGEVNWEGGLSLTVKVLKRPGVELGDYRSIVLGPPAAVTTDEEEIVRTLERLRDSKAELAPAEGKVAEDSFLLLDLEVFKDGHMVTDQSVENTLAEVRLMAPELREALLGAAEGEEREATVPGEGGPTVFRMRVKGVKRKEVPPLDDEFARHGSPQFIDKWPHSFSPTREKKYSSRLSPAT